MIHRLSARIAGATTPGLDTWATRRFGILMCGRYTLKTPGKVVADLFGLAEQPSLTPRYNIAPTQPVPIIRVLRTNPETKQCELVPLRWGLVPSWADDPAIGNRLINARAETVADKPSFRGAFRHRRCMVPADGFYEWKKEGTKKQPVYIRRRDGQPRLRRLWEEWERGGEVIESCAIITTGANDLMAEFHDRMPVILQPKDYGLWLDPEVQDSKLLEPLLRPCPSDEMEVYPVSRLVNDPRNEDPKCVEPQPQQGRTMSASILSETPTDQVAIRHVEPPDLRSER